MFPIRYPPEISVKVSWRDLYLAGALGQRELIEDSRLNRDAEKRSIRLGIGSKPMEEFDQAHVLQPICFADGGYWTGIGLPAVPVESLTFREEIEAAPWEKYAWEADFHPVTSALYSPWQGLYLDDVAEGGGTNVPLHVLLLPRRKRNKALSGVIQDWYRGLDLSWRNIDEMWRPLMKVLVAIQNEYWPFVSGQIALVHDPSNQTEYLEAGRSDEPVPPKALLDQIGCTSEELIAAYQFLVERGLDREPRDGLVMLRRARPRAFHVRWRGLPRRAQDHFDAAEMLRLFLVDLTGEPIPPPEAEPVDGRQDERAALYEHGPAATVGREKLKEELIKAELYPAGVEVMVDGQSEQRVVETVVTELLDERWLRDINFVDLHGSGGAVQVMPLASSLGAYAIRAVVIVDGEGKMGPYAKRAVELGVLPEEDLCLAPNNLEEDNSTPAELIELAKELAANPPEGREPVELMITEGELRNYHSERLERPGSKEPPGLADSLCKLAENHDPPAPISKVDLAGALARRIVSEFVPIQGNEKALKALYERRPVLGFIVRRIISAVNRPVPIS